MVTVTVTVTATLTLSLTLTPTLSPNPNPNPDPNPNPNPSLTPILILIRTLTAGHNKKVPLLLVCTAFTMLAGEEHKKTWKVHNADGTYQTKSITTPQPQVHYYYRQFMNIVDLHNKLRQGVVCMADV